MSRAPRPVVPPSVPRATAPAVTARDLLRDADGRIAPCIANVAAILAGDPRWRGVLAWDWKRGRVICTASPPWPSDCGPAWSHVPRDWTDDDDIRLAVWLRREHGVDVKLPIVRAAVRLAGQRKESPR